VELSVLASINGNFRTGNWLPDQPGHGWDAKPKPLKGVSSKPGNERTMSLEDLKKNNKPEFQVPNQGTAPSF
jgi:hypothetical protein